eukprot:2822636-Rhodomonas_salina.1
MALEPAQNIDASIPHAYISDDICDFEPNAWLTCKCDGGSEPRRLDRGAKGCVSAAAVLVLRLRVAVLEPRLGP